MAEVGLTINGKTYGISCDAGQEQRVLELSQYIDARLQEIKQSGAASNESHLFMLTSLVLADEVFSLREGIPESAAPSQNDAAVAEAISTIASRIDKLADQIDA